MDWLREIIGDENRVITENIEEKYLSDTLGRLKGDAAALVFVKSAEEVSAILREAHARRAAVTPRGAGTNLVGSTVPSDGGIILDFSLMNRVLELDRNTMTATVEPGIMLEDFQKYVEGEGFFYPPDPGEKQSTIGGNISTNAGGMRAVKYGVTRDYVRGLEVVLADGTIMTVGGKNVKDASGLSLKNLFIGSEGTLCAITKCVLKLIPKPEFSKSALIAYPDLDSGISSVLEILRANANPTAVEFIGRDVAELGEEFSGVKYPRPDAGSYILLTFDGQREEVENNVKRIQGLALSTGALEYIPLDDPAYAADIWKVRGALVKAVEATSEQEPVDIVVPISKTAEFIGFVKKVESKTGVRMVSFGHAGDGNVHLCVVRGERGDEEWREKLHEVMSQIYGKAYELGGVTSGEHGIGVSKREYFLRETPRENLVVMNNIKNALDPLHILNDKKSYILGE